MIYTVDGSPTLPRAFSISVDEQMCWSDLRNIFLFPLKAELIYHHKQVVNRGNNRAVVTVKAWLFQKLNYHWEEAFRGGNCGVIFRSLQLKLNNSSINLAAKEKDRVSLDSYQMEIISKLVWKKDGSGYKIEIQTSRSMLWYKIGPELRIISHYSPWILNVVFTSLHLLKCHGNTLSNSFHF